LQGVAVGVGVFVGVEGVRVGVLLGVRIGVAVAVLVGARVGVLVGVLMGASVGNDTVGSGKVGRTRIGVAVGVVVNAGVRGVGRGVSVAVGAGAVGDTLLVLGVGVRVAVDVGGAFVPADAGVMVDVAEIARPGVPVGRCVGVADGRTWSVALGLVPGMTPPAMLSGCRFAASSAAARMMAGSNGSSLGAERSTE
jgi:hypothetical protein